MTAFGNPEYEAGDGQVSLRGDVKKRLKAHAMHPHRRTIAWSALAILLFVAHLGVGGAVVAAEKRSNASSFPLSPSQKRYIKTYGYPEQFILLFISEEVDFQKRVKKVLPQPRRIEAWLYLTRERYLIFDNGYFSEESPTGVSIEDPEILPPTDLKPTQFTPAMTRSDITSRFGKPDTVEPVKLGKHLVEVYRYLTPVKGIKSFTFYDDRLQSIVASFAILPESGAVDQQK
jgi:hypothetical protein